ncbi:ABC transporter permease [Pseudomonas aeruginosa]|nr:ABC transporter permease [Pseudomonas aeruginosa]
MSRAPTIIQANANYVKKLVFPRRYSPSHRYWPLSSTPCSATWCSVSFFSSAASSRAGNWSCYRLPCSPFLLCVTGLAWFLAGLGVYVRDIGQFVQFLLVLLLFISPVFYPLSSLPPVMQPYLYLNPLTIPVEMVRAILFDAPYPTPWGLQRLLRCVAAGLFIGLLWFRRVQEGFADVL